MIDVLFKLLISLIFYFVFCNFWFVILIVSLQRYMMVLFAVSHVCLFHLVFMVLYLFIYSSLKICMQISKMSGGGCGGPLCEPHRLPGIPCPI